MSEEKKKKVYLNIGTVMQAKKDNPNDPKEAPRFYLKLGQRKDKNKKIVGEALFPITLANGVKLNEGDVLSMFDKRAQFKRAVENGKMDADKAKELEFLRYDVCVVEDVNEGSDAGSKSEGDDIPF